VLEEVVVMVVREAKGVMEELHLVFISTMQVVAQKRVLIPS
jgi:hypothetical protein